MNQREKRGIKSNGLMFVLNNKAMLILLILIVIAGVATKGLFLSYGNLSSVSRQIAVSVLIGLGFTVVLASAGVDLSVGHMLSLLGVIYAIFTLHVPMPIAIIGVVAVGMLCGLLNGSISEYLHLPPFIVTLATAQIFKGFAYLLTNGKSINGLSASVKYLGQGLVGGVIPISIVIALAVCLVLCVVMYRTKYGRHVIATGGNAEAALVSGISTQKIKVSAYVVMGICAALGAIVLTGRVSMAAPGAGDGMEMDAIAAVVIGGTPMSGGKVKVGGTVFGCLVIGVMNNLLNLLNVSSFWQWVAKGCIIIFAILIDVQSEKLINKRRGAQ